MRSIVIVGAGQAGISCAAKLRASGFDGDVALIGEEPQPPYQRPPLSKAYLLGEMTRERLYIRPESYYEKERINLRTGARVTGIDRENCEIVLMDERIGYDALVLTTGSVPHRLPAKIGGDLAGVFTVRDLSDVDAMAPHFKENVRVMIVGGGYIGLEAAAVAAKQGLRVTLVEREARILQRVAAPQTSDYFRALHKSHGVDIREGVGLECLKGEGAVSAAELSDGTLLPVDFVVVGIGIAPATRLASDAGLEIENGIKVDANGRTSDPSIWAAGDCASFPCKNKRIRLESVPHAIDQAELVAANILGAGTDYVAKPWFWSDQYDVKLQIAGLNTGYDTVVERRGAGQVASFWYYRGRQLLAVDAMNDPRGYMIGKRLIEAGKSADKTLVANPETDLKTLMAR
ncbi:MAG: FAD-dependent oxidoreductase [Pseudomonadota bacterium]